MPLPSQFISVDWGTSNFRLRVVQTDSLQILFENKDGYGVQDLHQHFLVQNSLDQLSFFQAYLQQKIQQIPAHFQPLPIVLTGMASSSIGLEELPYSGFPFDYTGDELICKTFSMPLGSRAILISGVSNTISMMRGEETQALGLAAHLRADLRATLILPGTHSKHLQFHNGQYTSVRTFMTGELFQVLSQRSILQQSVEKTAWNSESKASFLQGLGLGFQTGCTPNLFLIRAKDILEGANKGANFYLLSGLLIGEEISHLPTEPGQLFLAAAEPMYHLYKLALSTLLPHHQATFFDENQLTQALLAGQRKILERHAS